MLNSLRQLLETGKVVAIRVNQYVTCPLRFQLAAAMFLCLCAYLGDPVRACGSAPACGRHYVAYVSGSMIDRFYLIIQVPEVTVYM